MIMKEQKHELLVSNRDQRDGDDSQDQCSMLKIW